MRRMTSRWPVVAVSAAVVACATVALTRAPSGDGAQGRCTALERGVLPAWARTGFSDPMPRAPHAIGRHGRIAAVVLGDPLLSPPGAQRSNKILWVSRQPAKPPSDLRIRAQRVEGGRPVGEPVRRIVDGGPGPSTINLPAAGCWRLSLRWSGRSDELALRYAVPPQRRQRRPEARATGRATAARTVSSVPTRMSSVLARVTAV